MQLSSHLQGCQWLLKGLNTPHLTITIQRGRADQPRYFQIETHQNQTGPIPIPNSKPHVMDPY